MHMHMHIKAIGREVGEQLKNGYPDWHRLSRKENQSPKKL
jgi:hypothetical protein